SQHDHPEADPVRQVQFPDERQVSNVVIGPEVGEPEIQQKRVERSLQREETPDHNDGNDKDCAHSKPAGKTPTQGRAGTGAGKSSLDLSKDSASDQAPLVWRVRGKLDAERPVLRTPLSHEWRKSSHRKTSFSVNEVVCGSRPGGRPSVP